jgi:uncharacterized protein
VLFEFHRAAAFRARVRHGISQNEARATTLRPPIAGFIRTCRLGAGPVVMPARAPIGRATATAPRRVRGRWTVVGLDLAGSPNRATGCCVFRGPRTLTASVLGDDASIEAAVLAAEPDLVVIDAPLSLPRGRRTIDDRSGPHFRECDRELRRLGIRFFPLTLGPMRMLTVRGMRLRARLESHGLRVFEGYPGGAQDLLGIPRKRAGVEALQARLRRRGLGGDLKGRSLTHDELDAVTLAWVGQLYRKGEAILVGDTSEGLMLLPRGRGGRPTPSRSPTTRRPNASREGGGSNSRSPGGVKPA